MRHGTSLAGLLGFTRPETWPLLNALIVGTVFVLPFTIVLLVRRRRD